MKSHTLPRRTCGGVRTATINYPPVGKIVAGLWRQHCDVLGVWENADGPGDTRTSQSMRESLKGNKGLIGRRRTHDRARVENKLGSIENKLHATARGEMQDRCFLIIRKNAIARGSEVEEENKCHT